MCPHVEVLSHMATGYTFAAAFFQIIQGLFILVTGSAIAGSSLIAGTICMVSSVSLLVAGTLLMSGIRKRSLDRLTGWLIIFFVATLGSVIFCSFLIFVKALSVFNEARLVAFLGETKHSRSIISNKDLLSIHLAAYAFHNAASILCLTVVCLYRKNLMTEEDFEEASQLQCHSKKLHPKARFSIGDDGW